MKKIVAILGLLFMSSTVFASQAVVSDEQISEIYLSCSRTVYTAFCSQEALTKILKEQSQAPLEPSSPSQFIITSEQVSTMGLACTRTMYAGECFRDALDKIKKNQKMKSPELAIELCFEHMDDRAFYNYAYCMERTNKDLQSLLGQKNDQDQTKLQSILARCESESSNIDPKNFEGYWKKRMFLFTCLHDEARKLIN